MKIGQTLYYCQDSLLDEDYNFPIEFSKAEFYKTLKSGDILIKLKRPELSVWCFHVTRRDILLSKKALKKRLSILIKQKEQRAFEDYKKALKEIDKEKDSQKVALAKME